jgi:hypothetical protein
MSELISTGKKNASAAQTQLDGLVVNIELTLISIIQGVAFSFLAEQSREVIIGLQLVFWPYGVTGPLIILLFWSRSLIHTLTVIRWPLELGHNFLYIACTLIETVAFTQLTNRSSADWTKTVLSGSSGLAMGNNSRSTEPVESFDS